MSLGADGVRRSSLQAWQDRRVGDRYFAFLRAINTGNRRLTNDQLLAPFVEMGFSDVAAYQAAGNVTFRTDGAVDESVIESTLAEAYGFETPTFVRSSTEIAAVAKSEPFAPDQILGTAGKVQVTFLRDAPPPDRAAALAELAPIEDRVRVIGREWYWLPVAGVSGSALRVGDIERLCGVMTMRTLGTVMRMQARFPA
jgi:uncharacterized protein (DUF1697 family)